MGWWLILHTPDGPHVWSLGDPDEAAKDDLVMRARASIGFPTGESWLSYFDQWNPMLTLGDPHPSLLARSTVHKVTDLARLPDGELQTYRSNCEQSTREAHMAAAQAAIANLDPAQRDVLHAELTATRPSAPSFKEDHGPPTVDG